MTELKYGGGEPFFKVDPLEQKIDEDWVKFSESESFVNSDGQGQTDLRSEFIRENVMPYIPNEKHSEAGQIIESFIQHHRTPKELIGKKINLRGTPMDVYHRSVKKTDSMSGIPATQGHSFFLSNYGGAENALEKKAVLEGQGLVEKEDFYFDEKMEGMLTPSGIKKMGIDTPRPDYDLAIVPAPLKFEALPRNSRHIARLGAELTAAYYTSGASAVPAIARMFGTGYVVKTLDEAIEALQGYQKQDFSEISWDAFIEGGIVAGAEWATRLMSMVGRWASSGGTAVKNQGGESWINPFKRESWGGGDTGTMLNPFSKRNLQTITGLRPRLETRSGSPVEDPYGLNANITESPGIFGSNFKRGIGGFGGKDAQLKHHGSTVDPDVRATIETAMKEIGITPDISKLDRVGTSRLAAVIQGVAKMFGMGAGRERANAEQAMKYLIGMEKKLKVEARTDQVPEISITQLEAGLRKNIAKTQKRLDAQPEKTLRGVNLLLGQAKNMIQEGIKLKGTSPGVSQENISQVITNNLKMAYKLGSGKGGDLYRNIDTVLEHSGSANTKMIPTDNLKVIAEDILRRMPKTEKLVKVEGMTVIQEQEFLAAQELIANMKNIRNMGDLMTFEEAQHFRSLMTGKAYDRNLMKDVGEKTAGDFVRAIDDAFDGIVRNNPKGMPQQAIKALRRANNYWSKFKSNYDNAEIMDIVRTGSPDKYEIVKRLSTQSPEQIGNLMKPLSKEMRNSIRLEHFRHLVRNATDNSHGRTSGEDLLNQILKMKNDGNSLYKLYGEHSKPIEQYARELAIRNYHGTLGDQVKHATSRLASKESANILEYQAKEGVKGARPRDEIIDMMKTAIKEADEAFAYSQKNAVKIIKEGKEGEMVHVFDDMLRPDGKGVAIINDIEKAFADQPQILEQIKVKAFRRFMQQGLESVSKEQGFRKMVYGEGSNFGGMLFNGSKILEKTTKHFAGHEGDNAFIRLFGKPFAQDIRKFAKSVDLIGGSVKESIVERWMAMHPFGNIDKLTRFKILSHMLEKPAILNYYLDGYKRTKASKGAEAAIRGFAQALANVSRDIEIREQIADTMDYQEKLNFEKLSDERDYVGAE